MARLQRREVAGGALRQWVPVLVGIELVQAVSGMGRHRPVANWMLAAFRSDWVNAPVGRLGVGLPARTSTGEVVSVGATDTVAVAPGYGPGRAYR